MVDYFLSNGQKLEQLAILTCGTLSCASLPCQHVGLNWVDSRTCSDQLVFHGRKDECCQFCGLGLFFEAKMHLLLTKRNFRSTHTCKKGETFCFDSRNFRVDKKRVFCCIPSLTSTCAKYTAVPWTAASILPGSRTYQFANSRLMWLFLMYCCCVPHAF